MQYPSDLIIISIQTANRVTWKISGFPQNISWFQQQQGFDNHFGTSSHDAPGQIRCRDCTQQKRKGNHSFDRYPKQVKH